MPEPKYQNAHQMDPLHREETPEKAKIIPKKFFFIDDEFGLLRRS